MTRTVHFVAALLLLSSTALAQERFADSRRHFSFPVPSGWTRVSDEDLKEDYEEPNEGIDGKPTTLAAWEKNPSQSTSAPILLVRWRKVRHTDATAAYERLKTGGQAALDEIVAEQGITKHYKLGKVTFDAESASVRIPHGFESLRNEDTKILVVRYLGQYGIVWLEFRGPKGAFDASGKEIEATVAGFEWVSRYRVNYEPELPAAAPAPAPAPEPVSAAPYGSGPLDGPEEKADLPFAPELILVAVAVLLGIAVLAFVAVKMSGDRRPPPRRRGGGYRRR